MLAVGHWLCGFTPKRVDRSRIYANWQLFHWAGLRHCAGDLAQNAAGIYCYNELVSDNMTVWLILSSVAIAAT